MTCIYHFGFSSHICYMRRCRKFDIIHSSFIRSDNTIFKLSSLPTSVIHKCARKYCSRYDLSLTSIRLLIKAIEIIRMNDFLALFYILRFSLSSNLISLCAGGDVTNFAKTSFDKIFKTSIEDKRKTFINKTG